MPILAFACHLCPFEGAQSECLLFYIISRLHLPPTFFRDRSKDENFTHHFGTMLLKHSISRHFLHH